MKTFFVLSLLSVIGPPLMAACTTPVAATPTVYTPIQATTTATPLISTYGATDDFTTLSEEELALQIVETVIQVEAQTEIVLSTVMQLVSNENPVEEEFHQAIDVMNATKAEILGAEHAAQAYHDRYGQFSIDTTGLLTAIEEDLDEIDGLIDDVIASIEDDLAATNDLVGQLNHVVAKSELRVSVEGWLARILTQIDEREALYLKTQPQADRVANNRVEAFEQTHIFVDAFQEALEDDTFSPDELSAISQLGANTKASLYNTGDPPLFAYAETIERLLRNAARGEWALARSGIDALWRSLPARPQP